MLPGHRPRSAGRCQLSTINCPLSVRISFQETPNPHAGKFSVGQTLVEGRSGRTYDSAGAAAAEPVARRLLAEPGVRSVFMVADFVTVTRDPAVTWSDLAPRVKAALREVL
jgi:NFU1 iron-sulfur cluster scaffold homolog, mitochondrial